MNRNASMIARIEKTPVKYPFRFTILGDSAPYHSPVADAIFSEMLRQMENLNAKPLFFANLGDFAGPGTMNRHEHYLHLVEHLTIPNICLIGNHDRDDAVGWENFEKVHGPANFQLAYGHTCFVAMGCHAGEGPSEDDLAYLETRLREDGHPHRVVLMHVPPNLEGHYAPHPEWGFSRLESEFLSIIKAYDVKLVCCAHVLGYDYHAHDGTRYVVSGGGGWGVCSHFGMCFGRAMGTPPHRGSFYHFAEISIGESGAVSGRVIRAFEGARADPAYNFGETETE